MTGAQGWWTRFALVGSMCAGLALVAHCGHVDEEASSPDASVAVSDARDARREGEPLLVVDPGLGPRTKDSWSWVNPLPDGNTLRAAWGSGENDIWAVGDAGALRHWDGKSWVPYPSGTTARLTGVWGSASTDVWVTGWSSTLLHWNGSKWSTVPFAASGQLDCVSGTGGGDVWVGGSFGVAHWDGATWKVSALPISWAVEVQSISVVDASTAFASAGSQIFRWDGTKWTATNPAIGKGFVMAVWAAASNDAWAVTPFTGYPYYEGQILHWDGTDWRSASPSDFFVGLYGRSATDVWAMAAGLYGYALHHWDGKSWTRRGGPHARAMWGASERDVWSVGDWGSFRHWDGAAWSEPQGVTRADLTAVWGTSPTDIWIVGDGDLGREDDSSEDGGVGDAAGTDDRGTIMHWDGVRLSDVVGVTPEGSRLAVWGSSATDVWVAGASDWPTPRLQHWNGSVWTNEGPFASRAIWGSSSHDIWGGGEYGMHHFDGASWSSVLPDTNGVMAIAGSGADDVWLLGTRFGPEFAHWDGSKWSSVPKPTEWRPLALWALRKNDVWSVGEGGLIGHWDGSQWWKVPSGTFQNLRGVWGSGSEDVWAVGAEGTILHWNGSAWAASSSGTSNDLAAVYGFGPSTVWVVGAGGTVLRRQL